MLVFFLLTLSRSGDISCHELIEVVAEGAVAVIVVSALAWFSKDESLRYSLREVLSSSPFLPPRRCAIATGMTFAVAASITFGFSGIIGLANGEGALFDAALLVFGVLLIGSMTAIYGLKKRKAL